MSDSGRGRARAKGRTTAEVLRADRCEAPPPLLEERYEFLGDDDIPIGRYISREFFDREIESLWPRAWQWACREEHLQEVGDTHVYDVGPYSVIVVRSGEDSIEAFLNSCTHRGTRILSAEGSGFSRNFTCPFHGWCWNLDGSIENIPGRWGQRRRDIGISIWIAFLAAWLLTISLNPGSPQCGGWFHHGIATLNLSTLMRAFSLMAL